MSAFEAECPSWRAERVGVVCRQWTAFSSNRLGLCIGCKLQQVEWDELLQGGGQAGIVLAHCRRTERRAIAHSFCM